MLDRLVGYQISPILWAKVRRGLSAGRVQSVAVRVLVEREEEIRAFRSEEYWTVEVDLEGHEPPPFAARVVRVDGEKPSLAHEGQATEIVELVRQATPVVATVERKERRKNPPPPFITSRLQQEASSKLRFSPKRTMALAQRLYEGIELGAEGPTGLITYMRTDSTRISDDAVTAVRALIGSRFSPAHLPAEPNVFKTKKSAQDAHEAIRPTLLDHDPERVRALLTEAGAGRDARELDDLVKLYTLIWNRFRRLPDGARGVRSDDHRHHGRPRGLARERAGHALSRLPRRLRRDAGRRGGRGRGQRPQPARRQGGRNLAPARRAARAALHAAAAALLRGDAGARAGGEGHRPARRPTPPSCRPSRIAATPRSAKAASRRPSLAWW